MRWTAWFLGAELRAVAARGVAGVLRGSSLSTVLPAMLPRVEPRDRTLLQEMSYGVCRQAVRLEFWLERLLSRPLKAREYEVHALLLCGLYQLEYMRVPAHAAVAETVEAARLLKRAWAVGLVNGVLRGFQRRHDDLVAEADAIDAVRHACPGWLLNRLRKAWPARADAVLDAWLRRPPLTLRVNRRLGDGDAYRQRLEAVGLGAESVPGVADALTLTRPAPVERLPGFDQGLVSVQDAGAQLAATLLDVRAGQRVLDVCAAPGGKSGHLLEIADIELHALDNDPARLARVGENLERLRLSARLELADENLERLRLSARLELADASEPGGDWYRGDYERILLDAPCSATGVIRRHADIKLLRRNSDIEKLVELQYRILENVWPRLSAGGMLLYATCSLLPEENADQMIRFIAEHPDAEALPLKVDAALPAGPGMQILPGARDMDGFFYALLRKRPTA